MESFKNSPIEDELFSLLGKIRLRAQMAESAYGKILHEKRLLVEELQNLKMQLNVPDTVFCCEVSGSEINRLKHHLSKKGHERLEDDFRKRENRSEGSDNDTDSAQIRHWCRTRKVNFPGRYDRECLMMFFQRLGRRIK